MTAPMHENTNEKTMIEAARYVDGQLDTPQRAAFEARLLREPDLRAAVQETRALRLVIAHAAADEPPVVPPTFRTRVLQEIRRVPSREELLEDVAEATAEPGAAFATARRLLAAAALIFGLALLMFSGLLRSADHARLEATPGVLKQLDELDAKIKAAIQERGK